jgi:7-cyano-7-deazaguanine synthase in queuosine biosynthesis
MSMPNKVRFAYSASDTGAFVRLATDADERVIFQSPAAVVGRYVIRREGFSELLFKELPPLFADWLDVALFVYLADRASLRRSKRRPDYPDQWGRSIRLRLPVREPAVWNSPRVNECLQSLLAWLTDDEWEFEFVGKAGWRTQPEQTYLFEWLGSKPRRVCLFSGGLDSFAGAVRDLAAHPAHHHVLVSGCTNYRQQHQQETQLAGLRQVFSPEITHLLVPYGIRARVDGKAEERSQRTRGFMHLTLGAVTAKLCGEQALYLTENGVGAINLPYNAGQIGTANSRAVHPVTLSLMESFIAAATEVSFRIENLGLFSTKGELCALPAMSSVAHLVKETFSCDGFPNRVADKPQCGRCTSCLLRRQSLFHAGIADPSEHYVYDLRESHEDQSFAAFRAMSAQAHSILYWKNRGETAFHTHFPQLWECTEVLASRVTGGKPVVSRLLDSLFDRYAREWLQFANPQTVAEPEPLLVL